MNQDIKTLLANYDRHFRRLPRWRYQLLVVDNHFLSCYSFFMLAYRYPQRQHYSYDLLEIPHDPERFARALSALQSYSKLTIAYRRSAPERLTPDYPYLLTHDASHGHQPNPND